MNGPMRTTGPGDAIALANRQQGEASDPGVSAFVSASAGSGKTKLLIDRLLRLMLPREAPGTVSGERLPGTDPARIQCLTFTKAAAAEMSIRLQRELGRWVTLEDASLDRRLAALGCDTGPEMRVAARALFARVLDLPGGMRIGTIHAFCQSLLRRFPVEASISPQFDLVEETDARLVLGRAWEEVLAAQAAEPDAQAALALLGAQANAGDVAGLVTQLQARAPLLKPALLAAEADPGAIERRLRRLAGIRHADETACVAAATALPEEADFLAALRRIAEEASPKVAERATAMLDWLSHPHEARARHWERWREFFLTKEGKPRGETAFVNKKLADKAPELLALCLAEAERIAAVDDSCRALRMVALTSALLRFAAPVLRRYEAAKRERGVLDYDDLIARTLELLRRPGSAWVLYKLDGGIDHLLLDEVQDTSRLQWEIAGALTEEFFAGLGADDASGRPRALPRTMFAVGDYKQSIYSFQGADPAAFHSWHETFKRRVQEGGAQWREPGLNVSFRSTVPVLALVDAVFADPEAARGVVEPGNASPVRHHSARPEAPGCVELWPLVPAKQDEERETGGAAEDPWSAPAANRGQISAQQRLADHLAGAIAREIGRVHETGGTPLTPGDVLVLVPRRSPFVRALIRALKGEGVPVATLVRTSLVDQLAVQDLLALCDVLLLPQDDLTLGCVLTSPLGALSDDSLMALALGRGRRPLWDTLRDRAPERPEWQRAWAFLSALFGRVDYLSPHALLSEALGRGGGRARLLARLGPEAAEPVDELLSAALRHAESHPPSLQGFLQWLRRSEETIKREPEAAGDAVRVMTAHGAKGLQARLVIVPDTTRGGATEDALLWNEARGDGDMALPFWVPRADLASAPTRRLREALRAAAQEESNRLLYVALTRAADRLVICGWEPGRGGDALPPQSWYPLCRAGLEKAGAVAAPFAGPWPGERLVLAHGGGAEVSPAAPPRTAPAPSLPDWLGRAPDWKAAPPPPEPALPRPLAPSRPDDVTLGPAPALRSPLEAGAAPGRTDAFRRGRLAHALLQHLPELPADERMAAALRLLTAGPDGMQPAEAGSLADDVLAVLEHPDLQPLFAAGAAAEQPVAGLAGGVVVTGQIDRLRVLPDRVLLCDFKTNRRTPATPDDVPVPYLRQMSAYRALLAQLYPDRLVVCLLVWTQEVRAMELPEALLLRHAPETYRAVGNRVPG